MVELKKIKISRIDSFIIKGDFGDGKYFGYKKTKLISLIKIFTNKKNIGVGESLIGTYSPTLFLKNLNFLNLILAKKNILEVIKTLKNIQKNKFFCNNGILKNLIAAIEIGIINLISEIKNQSFAKTAYEIYFSDFNFEINNFVNVYASAGSINSNINDLKKDINKSKILNINKIKIRIKTDNNYRTKIKFLKNSINNFSIDLIANTYEKNRDYKNLEGILNYLKSINPLWVEEALNVNDLEKFEKIKKKFSLKYSYGENFNSYYDFFNLIKYYKFDYINPDISHLPISELANIIRFLEKNQLKEKIIFHCWGSVVNLYATLQISRFLGDFVKLVELPITNFSLNDQFIQKAEILDSKFYFNEKLNINNYYSNMTNIKNIKLLKKYSFNFD